MPGRVSDYHISNHDLEAFDHAIWVLMWKHLKERKRCLCHTIWEIISGVLVFAVFFLVSQTLRHEDAEAGPPSIINDVNITNIFFTPNNSFNMLLMNRVAQKIKEHNVTYQTDIVHGFRNTDDMYNFAKFLEPNGMVVIKFESDPISSIFFKYSLGKVRTEETNELYLMLDGYIDLEAVEDDASQALAKLQWAIDSTYMEQLSDHNITHDIQLQEPINQVSKELHIIHSFLILCTIVAPLPFFLYSSSRLVIERRSGLKEFMKMMRVSPNTLRCSHLIDTVMVGIAYSTLITLFLKVTTNPILPHSSGILIGITMILHFLNTTSLAFITSALSQDFNHADSLAMLTYMCTYMLGFIWYSSLPSQSLVVVCIACCLLPHAPVYVFWDEVIALELTGEGVSFFKMFSAPKEDSLAVAFVWLLFIAHLLLIMLVAWYCDLIRPGRYGIAKEWTFVFENEFWSSKKKKVTFHVTAEKVEVPRDDRFFEKPLKGVDVAIKIVDVSKIFSLSGRPDVLALDAINLDIYRGEVTVLLGANGAGKSTLLYIITGMYGSTKGKVYINGLDISYRIQELRKDFGLCPQNNVTFEYLTVRENIRFFEMLKSVKEPQRSNADRLLNQLKLMDKADYFSRQLCGGKKRCLQELRGHKTVLMATSCLEEADALGDRVALLNSGKLRCHGTPRFLKKAIGAGFNLSVTLKHQRHAEYVKNLVESTVPFATSKMFENKRIIFKLPSTEQDRFPLLFDLLEEKKKELGIALIEVGMFMEEIFLEFIDQQKDNDLVIDSSLRNIHDQRLEGISLTLQQLRVLLIRSFVYMWRKKTQFIVLQIVLPIVSIIVITLSSNSMMGYGVMHDSHAASIIRLVYNTGPYRRTGLFDNLKNTDPGLQTVYSKDVSTAHHAPQTMGFEMHEKVSTIYFPVESQVVASKAVNIFSNIFMAVHMPYVVNHSIETAYDDIEMRTTQGVVKPKNLLLCMEWAMWMVFLSVFPLAPQVLLSVREYLIGTRHNHYMAGCTPMIHWSSKLVAQSSVYIVIIPFTVLFAAYMLDFDNTLNQLPFLGCLTAMLIVFGPAFLAHIYVLSFFLDVNHATSLIYIMTLVFGVVVPIFLYVFDHIRRTLEWLSVPHVILTGLAYTSPVYTFSVGLCRLTSTARLNAYCSLNKHLCPNLVVDDFMFVDDECCEAPSSSPYEYFATVASGLYDMLLLLVHFLVNSAIVIIIEYRVWPNIMNWILNYMYKEPQQYYDEPTVLKEIEYVQEKMKNNDFMDDALLVCNLHKHFFVSLTKRNHSRYIFPVRGISFSAKYGECICILGPNGAGKTATLLMLAGYLSMTRGDTCVGGTCIRRNRSQYLHKINLISASTGLDGFLSGQQNLILFARLQGYTEYACNRLARQMLAYMGLQSFSNTNVAKYSVGCSRRLSLCTSLVVCPMVALLEEPMTMVDPYTRPLVVRALKRMLNDAAAVVVTETSLERAQMELIFDRVAIMFRGQFAALGTAQQVNASLATGYSVRIKLRMVVAYKTNNEVEVLPSSLDTIVTTVTTLSGSMKDAEINLINNTRNFEESNRTIVLDEEEEKKEAKKVKDANKARDADRAKGVMDELDSLDIDERRMLRQTSILYAEDVRDLKKDMEEIFPTSELTNEHLCMLHYYIEDFDKQYQYSNLFTKLENLKERYVDIIEDYTLSVATVEEVYRTLEKEQNLKKIVIGKGSRLRISE